jgi:hypothetical protein
MRCQFPHQSQRAQKKVISSLFALRHDISGVNEARTCSPIDAVIAGGPEHDNLVQRRISMLLS